MTKVIFCLIVCCLNLPASAIDYNDFPPNLQQILDERVAELEPNGGICIAGRVTMSDGAYIGSGSGVMVNLNSRVDEPLWVYEDGWFIMGRAFRTSDVRDRSKIILRAFGYKPIDAAIGIRNGQMTYVEFVMDKTPPEDIASISGIVLNDQNEPVEGVSVRLSFPFSTHGCENEPYMSTVTGPDGQYFFDGLSSAEHSVLASASGYAYDSVSVTPAAGQETIIGLKLFPHLKIIIDYVYQADGSRSFTAVDIEAGTIEWINGGQGVDFSDGGVEGYEWESLRDIEMTQERGVLKFRIFYCNGRNGFCDMGPVDFESVTESPRTTYKVEPKPCVVGHVYVVRTYEDNWAKFVVRDILGGQDDMQ